MECGLSPCNTRLEAFLNSHEALRFASLKFYPNNKDIMGKEFQNAKGKAYCTSFRGRGKSILSTLTFSAVPKACY